MVHYLPLSLVLTITSWSLPHLSHIQITFVLWTLLACVLNSQSLTLKQCLENLFHHFFFFGASCTIQWVEPSTYGPTSEDIPFSLWPNYFTIFQEGYYCLLNTNGSKPPPFFVPLYFLLSFLEYLSKISYNLDFLPLNPLNVPNMCLGTTKVLKLAT